MKKVFLFATAALMSASVFVSCGPSEEEKKKMEDSLAKMLNESFSNLGNAMNAAMDSTAKTMDSTAAATTTTPAAETK